MIISEINDRLRKRDVTLCHSHVCPKFYSILIVIVFVVYFFRFAEEFSVWCIMESPQRRSGIPIPKSKSALKKHMSKSSDDLLGDNYGDHNTSGDLDLFTLLEENIALKEKTENLLSQKNSRMC